MDGWRQSMRRARVCCYGLSSDGTLVAWLTHPPRLACCAGLHCMRARRRPHSHSREGGPGAGPGKRAAARAAALGRASGATDRAAVRGIGGRGGGILPPAYGAAFQVRVPRCTSYSGEARRLDVPLPVPFGCPLLPPCTLPLLFLALQCVVAAVRGRAQHGSRAPAQPGGGCAGALCSPAAAAASAPQGKGSCGGGDAGVWARCHKLLVKSRAQPRLRLAPSPSSLLFSLSPPPGCASLSLVPPLPARRRCRRG